MADNDTNGKNMTIIDEMDCKFVELMQEDGTLTNTEFAPRLGKFIF
jgi:hypothetical protein